MPEPIPDDELLDEIRRLAEDGVAPSQREMFENGKWRMKPFRRAFGSWLGAVDAAGLEPAPKGRPKGVAREELIDELQRLAEDGHAPNKHTMNREGAFSDSPFLRTFGSWEAACEAAGLHEPIPKNLSPVMREALKAQRQEEAAMGGD